MRVAAALAAPLLLGACVMTGAPDGTRLPGDSSSDVPAAQAGGFACDAGAAEMLIGETPSQALGTRVMNLTGARQLRWIGPGMAVTMEFREGRVNVYYDADYRVERISCG